MSGHTWQDKLAWVGMEWETIRHPMRKDELVEALILCSKVVVRVRTPGGRVSYGYGDTLELALEDGARGQNIDWSSVERKITEAAWAEIAHC